jgi:hypothetical protein
VSQNGYGGPAGPRQPRVAGVSTRHGHRSHAQRGGVAAVSAAATGPSFDLHGGHEGNNGVALDTVAEGGAHPGRPLTVRWWKGLRRRRSGDGEGVDDRR